MPEEPPAGAPRPDFPRQVVCVTGIIRNDSGQLLLVKHPRRGWEPVGGQVELGEDAMEGLVREAREESGYLVEVTRLLGVYQNTGTDNSEPKVCLVFSGKVVGGEATTSSESVSVGWFDDGDALRLVQFAPVAERVRDALMRPDQVPFKAYRREPEFAVTRRLS